MSQLFARALKKAWKLPRGFSSTVLQTEGAAGGLDLPVAEVVQLHEMIGLSKQSFHHDDWVKRLMEYEFREAKRHHGCAGYEELAAEVAISGSTSTFPERLLGSIHSHGLTVTESGVSP
eukprot:3129329-Rhodomonas_salina.1